MNNEQPKIKSAKVMELEPFALPTEEAGAYLGKSGSWMRSMRRLDRERLEEGLPPFGPRWRVLGQTVFYLRRDLEDWLHRNSIERGEAKYRGHVGGKVEP